MSRVGGGAGGFDAVELLARDRAARALAQQRFDRPLVLEAGAGTGKTTTLIARLLAWCLGPGWQRASEAVPALAAAERRADSPAPAAGSQGDTAPAASAVEAAAAETVARRVLRRVVALTFTEAAAAEMAARAARQLRALAGGGEVPDWLAAAELPPLAERVRRAGALLGAIDYLRVETIHAFCLDLLATHPLEAGVHPRLQIDADGRLLQQVIAETVESALRPGYGAPGDPHLLALAATGCGPREVADALAALLAAGLPSTALRRDPFAGDGWARLRRRLLAASGDLDALLAPRLAGSRARLKLAASLVDALATLRRAAGAADSPAAAADDAAEGSADAEIAGLRETLAAALPANLRARLAEWANGRLKSKEEETRLGEVRGAVAAAAAALRRLLDHLATLDPPRLRHARLALAPLLAAIENELRRRGVATFDALLRDARRLLATHPEVRAALRRSIDQLLVDEFQDTDATQCDVLRWIALDGPAAERPTLFLVGDPKQSIYGWRSADLRAYDGFVAQVAAAGGEVLPLVENFRSVPAILDEVGCVIEPVMRERPGVQPAFAPLIPCERRLADPGFARGGRSAVEHWISWSIDEETHDTSATPEAAEPADFPPSPELPAPAVPAAAPPRLVAGAAGATVAAALEAEAIAADLRALHAEHAVAWSDAAILLRGTGDLDTYLDALRRAGIPFAVGRDKQYFRRREVIDAAALVRAVLDPGDHLALITFLRSPMVGVPDAALLPLWRHEVPRLLTELLDPAPERLEVVRRAVQAALAEVPREVPGLERVAGWELSLLTAVEGLAALRASFAAEPADVFVERLRRLLLVDATAAARYLGSYRLANLDRFFRQLLAEMEEGGGDVSAVLRALRDSVALGREAEEGKPPEGAEDAVQVLTIHGAKGLDFTHVYLPQLHKASGSDRPPDTAAGRLDRQPSAPSEPPAPSVPDRASPSAAEPSEGWEYRLLGAATPDFDRLEERRREVEAAERVRTLYVAMTRAKDRLVLAASWPLAEAAARVAPEQARTHLQLLAWRPGCPDLARLWQDGVAAATSPGFASRPPASAFAPAAADDEERPAAAPTNGVTWRFPFLAGRTPSSAPSWTLADAPPPPASTAPAGPSGSVAAHAASLAASASQAAWRAAVRHAGEHRMARPFGAAASEEAHAQLREELAAHLAAATGDAAGTAGPPEVRDTPASRGVPTVLAPPVPDATPDAPIPAREPASARPGPGPRPGERDAAMAAGAALHRAFEMWDLQADPHAEAERQRALLPVYLSAVAAGAELERALPRAVRLLDRFAAAGLAARLRGLAAAVLARELPVLLAPAADAPTPAASAPVGFVSGAIDLLYRDPATDGLVIADYKTDEVEGAEVERRAATYASQGAIYSRAVQEALQLASAPRFELWFVHAGRVVAAG